MILAHQLASGSSLVLSKAGPGSADSLFLIVGGGRGCTLKVDEPFAGLWVPLRGRLQIGGGSGDGVLVAGEMRVTEAEPRLHAVGRGNAVWIALLGGRAAWREALEGLSDLPIAEPLLLPTWHSADRTLRMRLVALARAAANGGAEEALAGCV